MLEIFEIVLVISPDVFFNNHPEPVKLLKLLINLLLIQIIIYYTNIIKILCIIDK
jgi:hypothetical protein